MSTQSAASMPTYAQYRALVPPLTANLRKGQGDHLFVLDNDGRRHSYTGAPYFGGMGALRLGADLAHVICDEDAATAIKSYSPDLIVHPYIKIRTTSELQDEGEVNMIWAQTFDDISALLKRVHVLAVGPGLSRDKGMLQCAKHAIEKARELEMPIVIDADALFLIQNEPDLVQGYAKAILTPNLVEFGRLCDVKNVDVEDSESEKAAVQTLSQAFDGVIVVRKGPNDIISNGKTVHVVVNEGGLKRSGGQGDILAGMIATSLAWGVAYEKNVWDHSHPVLEEEVPLIACFGACIINRECSRLAFNKHKRAVQASDVLEEIGPFFFNFYDKARPNAGWGEAIYG
ncbi:hypothetical protein BGZ58_006822 [Dissophora ornata]|nr:hypothetical protein BGZ58_006822 [Dissophora ornata]